MIVLSCSSSTDEQVQVNTIYSMEDASKLGIKNLMKNDFESVIKEQLSVAMYRENLDDIPQFLLPPKVSIRPFRAGDDKTWFNIQSAAARYSTFTSESFQKAFGTDIQCDFLIFFNTR